VLTGFGGSDRLDGGAGKDSLDGGEGNDTLVYDAADGLVDGGAGFDILQVSGTASVTIDLNKAAYIGIEAAAGSNGGDKISGNASGSVLFGNRGADTLTGGAGSDSLYGGNDNDRLYGGLGTDNLYGDLGNDTLIYDAADGLLDGGDGTDILLVQGNDAVAIDLSAAMFAGLERVISGGGSDTLGGTAGNDYLDGGSGNDLLAGSGGSDTLLGGLGNDTLMYDAADNARNVKGGSGNDALDCSGASAAVMLDLLQYTANDLENLAGSSYDDTLSGNALRNLMDGGAGNDTLAGKGGNDMLYGQNGNDLLDGGRGNDTLTGGEGSDSYSFRLGDGKDFISDDPQWYANDMIRFEGGIEFQDLVMSQNGANYQIGSVTVLNCVTPEGILLPQLFASGDNSGMGATYYYDQTNGWTQV